MADTISKGKPKSIIGARRYSEFATVSRLNPGEGSIHETDLFKLFIKKSQISDF
jgi:hypothetical protein